MNPPSPPPPSNDFTHDVELGDEYFARFLLEATGKPDDLNHGADHYPWVEGGPNFASVQESVEAPPSTQSPAMPGSQDADLGTQNYSEHEINCSNFDLPEDNPHIEYVSNEPRNYQYALNLPGDNPQKEHASNELGNDQYALNLLDVNPQREHASHQLRNDQYGPNQFYFTGMGSGFGDAAYTPIQPILDEQNTGSYQYTQSQIELPPQPQYPLQPLVGQSVPKFSYQHADFQNGGFSGVASTQFPSSVSASGPQTPYKHDILNQFQDPSVPLRVLDKHLCFSNEVLNALTQELTPFSQKSLNYANRKLSIFQNERETELQSGLERSASTQHLAVPEQTPRSQSGASTPASKASKSKRQRNIKQFDPKKVYKALPGSPPPWKTVPPGRPTTTFEYTSYGELTPGRRYTTQEITDFIQYHPGHKNLSKNDVRFRSELILWIQSTPADSKTRYPKVDSAKCRFENCPTKGGTIRTGEFRICFDEQSEIYGDSVDPYHNAGYAHLYCMEANFNFHKLCQDFRVMPDDRQQRHESANRMAINRDRHSMLDICEQYMKRDGRLMHEKAFNDVNNEWFKHSLTFALTSHHVENMSIHTRRQMDQRNGFSLADHMGDLKKLMEFKTAPKEVKDAFKKQYKAKKRAAEEMNDDEDAEFEEESDGASEYGYAQKRRRKR